MIPINRALHAKCVSEHLLELWIVSDCSAPLSFADLAALRELLMGEGIGSCHHCNVPVLTAAQCQRICILGVWQWCCPTCHRPLTPFPY